jgi:hypothetical protein
MALLWVYREELVESATWGTTRGWTLHSVTTILSAPVFRLTTLRGTYSSLVSRSVNFLLFIPWLTFNESPLDRQLPLSIVSQVCKRSIL